MLKKWLARKKDQEAIVLAEVRAALRKQEVEHTKETDLMRLETFNIKNTFEAKLNEELQRLLKAKDQECKTEINLLKEEHKLSELTHNAETQELKEKIKFAQKFWRDLYADKDELYNLAIVLHSKSEIDLKTERDELQNRVTQKADDMKRIVACLQQIENLSRRIDKRNEFGEKLLNLLSEE